MYVKAELSPKFCQALARAQFENPRPTDNSGSEAKLISKVKVPSGEGLPFGIRHGPTDYVSPASARVEETRGLDM